MIPRECVRLSRFCCFQGVPAVDWWAALDCQCITADNSSFITLTLQSRSRYPLVSNLTSPPNCRPVTLLAVAGSPRIKDMAAADSQSEYVTLVSSDDYSFVVRRSAACISGAIKRMLDPTCQYILFTARNCLELRFGTISRLSRASMEMKGMRKKMLTL
jgi:hypothetical protein